jgi:nickel-dependent lactate racemase
MITQIKFPYGKSSLTASIPSENIAMTLRRRRVKGLENETEALLKALRSPIGSRALCESVNINSKVAVIVTDNTRACPDNRILPVLLAELERKIARENITIIIALGLHQPLSQPELIEKLGENIISQYKVINHDINQTIRIGTTSRGNPVEVSRWVVEADYRISTGFIEPHFFAGFSGGGKNIMPGVSSPKAIHHNHSFEMIEHPLSKAGILRGNPIHEDIVEQAMIAKLDFIVNVLLDDNKKITHVVAGEPVEAHEKGCEIEKSHAGIKVSRKVDITITSNSGAPLDLDLYQTCKGIDNASQITRDGGIIIMASACSKGVGAAAFRQFHASSRSPKEVLQKIKREESVGYWENQVLARAQLAKDIYLFSELDPSSVRDMMIVPVRSIEEGLQRALGELGNRAEIAIIPEGPLTLPLLEV